MVSPSEIVAQVLGNERAKALFDVDGNALRRLHYSTPPEFRYDRPVCATTTRLSQIKKEDKPTVGVNLATHLYEFIREIRGRVDQYTAFFEETKAYLTAEKQAHPDLTPYLTELEKLVVEAQGKAQEIYATPLPIVEKKIDAMKNLLREGKGDGFDCGALDVRSPAGAQDDLCRRDNRMVLRLTQTAALNCGSSPNSRGWPSICGMHLVRSCASPPAGSRGERSIFLNLEARPPSMKRKLFLGLVGSLTLLAGCGVQTKDAAPAPSPRAKASSASELISLPAGEFTMGADDGAIDTKPAHKVKFDAFLIDPHEVTQEVYEKVMGTNPSRRKSLKDPSSK